MRSNLLYRFRSLFRREAFEAELNEELSYPRDREARGTGLIDDLVHDLRFALRQLRRNLSFTFTAVAVFGLGIGATAVIFAFVDAILVKPLPYHDSSRLVALFERIPIGERYHISDPDYLDWKRLNRVFTSLDVYFTGRVIFNTATGAEESSGAKVSDGFFRTLGVIPFLGRDFIPGEDQPSAAQTVILSYEAWQKRFGSDKNVVGQTIRLDRAPYTIVGVLPGGFHFAPAGPVEFWTTTHGFCAGNRMCHPYYGVARLKDGISLPTASADLASIARQIAVAYPDSNRDRSATVLPLTDVIVGDIRPTLRALLGGAGLLSLIGFMNVSGLLLVKAESRRREISVRGTLGASRIRLLRQFVVEGFLLAGCGGCLGLAFSFGAMRVLRGQIPNAVLENMPYLRSLGFNLHSLLFVLFVSILGGVLFSATPALHLLFSDSQQGLVEGGRTVSGRTWRKVGSSLVVFELAITVVLLMSAGLLAKSFYRLLHVDIGIAVEHLAAVHILESEDSTSAHTISVERQILAQMAALPGVTSVGVSQQLAVNSGEEFTRLFVHFRVFGRSYAGPGDEANSRVVSFGYFETLRARLLKGRYFNEADNASKPPMAIINRTMAEQVFPGEDPLGRHIVNEYDTKHPIEIIGIVDDIKEGALDMKPTSIVYSPFDQNPMKDFHVTLRTSQAEQTLFPSMVRVVHGIDHGLIADGEETMSSRIDGSQAAYLHRAAAWIVTSFAALALLLGTVGLYGVISYSVGQRTREIGVRIALGAQRSSIYRLILSEAGWLTTFGMTGGILCALGAAGFLRSMLFGVSPWDIGTLLSVTVLLISSTFLASYIPSRRAAFVNPTEALRTE